MNIRCESLPINILIICLMALIVLGLSGVASAQPQRAKLDSILDLHLAALGDKDSLESLKTIIAQMESEDNGDTGQRIDHYKFPDRCRTKLSDGSVPVSYGCDGKTTWYYNTAGPVIKNIPQHIASCYNDLFLTGYKYLLPAKNYSRIKLRNDTTINEENYYQLAMFPPRGDSIYTFINTGSGRLECFITFDGAELSTTHLSDFKTVGGIEIAFHQQTGTPESNIRSVLRIESIKINDPIPDSVFEIPGLSYLFDNRRFLNNADSAVVKFSFKKEQVTIKAKVNGKKKFKFLLDTGAISTLISEKMARKLKLKLSGDATGSGVSGTAKYQFAEMDSIQIGDVVWYPGWITVLADKKASKLFFDNCDAILGYKFFASFPMRIDFDRKGLVLYKHNSKEILPGGMPVTINTNNGQALKEMSLDGRPIRAVVDLGAFGDVFLFSNYRWFYKYSRKLRHDRDAGSVSGIGGSRPIKTTGATSLKFDDISIENPDLVIAYRPEGFTESRGTEALIGAGILKRFNLFIDYSNNVIYFDKREKYK